MARRRFFRGQSLRQTQQHFNLYSHSELRIQVCYHPCVPQKCVKIVMEGEIDRQEERDGFSSLDLSDGYQQRGRQLRKEAGEGGSRQRSNDTSHQLTPQERRQYEWYVKEFEKADLARDPSAERERGFP